MPWARPGSTARTTRLAIQVEKVELDPSSPGIVYAAGFNGFFKSIDGGATWTRKRQGLPPSSGLSELAVSPSGALYGVAPVQYPAVVFRSLDQGESWSRLGAIPDVAIRGFAFSPDGSIVLAGTDRGLYRKNSAGPDWTRVRAAPRVEVRTVAVAPGSPQTIYVGLGSVGSSTGVHKSSDGGASWTPANRGLGGQAILDAVIAPSNPAVIYANPLGAHVLARSSDGGATWRYPALGVDAFELAVDPRNEDAVYAANGYGGFSRSEDGGASWTRRKIEDGGCAHPISLTVDPRRPSRLFLAGALETGCARGHETSCLSLKTTDAGESWTCLEGARSAYFATVVPDPRHAEILYGAGVDESGLEGVFKSTDGGQTWIDSSHGIVGRPVRALAISPQGVLWAGGASVYTSRNGGRTWRRSARGLPGNGWIGDLVVAPPDPSVLYVSYLSFASNGDSTADLYVSTDGGASWRRLPEPSLPVLRTNPLYALLVDPRNAGRLYVATPLGLYRLDGARE